MKKKSRLAPARKRLPASAIIAALSIFASGAIADVVELTWDANGRFERTLAVAPGKFTEACGKLAAGVKVQWHFAASTPLDFNVHYHLGKDVVFPSKLSAVTTAKDTLATKSEEDYCWMWSNQSASVATVKFMLQR